MTVEKISIMDFIKSLPFFDEFSDDEKSKIINMEGVFEKYKKEKKLLNRVKSNHGYSLSCLEKFALLSHLRKILMKNVFLLKTR